MNTALKSENESNFTRSNVSVEIKPIKFYFSTKSIQSLANFMEENSTSKL